MNPLLSALVAAGIISPDDAERINRSMDADAARAWAEQQMAVAVQNGLSAQQARLVDMVRRTNGNLSAAMLDDFWRQEDARLFAALRATIEDVAGESAIGMAVRMGGDADMWRTVNEQVLTWARDYYTSPNPNFVGSVPNLNQTAREQFAPLFEAWNRGELDNGGRGLPQLTRALEPVFGPQRSAVISATETTRIFTESIVAAGDADDAVVAYEWMTANDEIVCPICAPLNGQRVRKGVRAFGTVSFPPAHPNCRCSVTEITGGMEQLERGRTNNG